jgi:hypothetical protein
MQCNAMQCMHVAVVTVRVHGHPQVASFTYPRMQREARTTCVVCVRELTESLVIQQYFFSYNKLMNNTFTHDFIVHL